MNARIKEIEIQSVFYNEDTQSWEFDREKFAKLIVRECLRVSYNSADILKSTNPAYSDGIMSNNLAIREHFGVEE
jgi:hypothetical protein